ncbi:MAG: LLM class flavin-dependent oxidoreductase [candidate division NC10 bacterium]|nr:LLM class flavin-dependent oxidoreductase [candidate division NC10 bacterium]
MKFGFYATGSGSASYEDLLSQVEYAEEAGFDTVWLRERHFHPDHQGRNFFSSPLVAAAYIAGRTERIRIGIASRILPLDHPIHIAEDSSTVDVISNGRLDLGIARVGENDLYQLAFGVTTEQSRGRFEEALDILLQAWTKERFSYNGQYYKTPEVSVYPKPIQKPHPPIYLVGISPQTLTFGSTRGFPLILAAAQTISVVRETQEHYSKALEEAGYKREDVVLPVNRFLYVAETNEQAVEETKEALTIFIHRGASVIRDFLFLPQGEITYDLLFNEVCIFGDPDYCIARLEKLKKEIDLRSLICTFNYYTIDHAKCRRSMERFVKYVMPHFENGC